VCNWGVERLLWLLLAALHAECLLGFLKPEAARRWARHRLAAGSAYGCGDPFWLTRNTHTHHGHGVQLCYFKSQGGGRGTAAVHAHPLERAGVRMGFAVWRFFLMAEKKRLKRVK